MSSQTATFAAASLACALQAIWVKIENVQGVAESISDDSGGATSTLEGAVGVVRKRHSNDTIVTPSTLPFVHLVLLPCSEGSSDLPKRALQSCPFERIGNEMVSQIHSHFILQQDFFCLSYCHRQFSWKESIFEKRRTRWQTKAGHPERTTPTHWHNSWWVHYEELLAEIVDDCNWEASQLHRVLKT